MLSKGRKIERLAGGGLLNVGVAALAVCYAGGLAIAAAGYARPGRAGQGVTDKLKSADAATYRAIGVFTEDVTGGAADGDKTVNVQLGTFPFKNSAGAEAVTIADLGKLVFVVDDETVAKTSAGGTRCVAGICRGIDATGVLVEVGTTAASPSANRVFVSFAISETDTLAGTSAELVSPVAGNITALYVIVQKAVTTGGPVTVSVDGTAVDGLSAAVADAAAKGAIVTDTPTAGHASRAVAVGSRIQVIPDAAFNTGGAISGFVEITA